MCNGVLYIVVKIVELEVLLLEFHERVKAFRTEVLKLQQGQLANMIGISQSCLSNYENGIREYPRETLQKISVVANMSYYEFMKIIDPFHEQFKRLNPAEQIQLAKEAREGLLAGFITSHQELFASDARLRDHILLISKLPDEVREQYLMNEIKVLKELKKS